MKDFEYSLIGVLPPVVVTLVSIVVTVFVLSETRKESLIRWLAINAFSGIFEKKDKTDNGRDITWLFKGIDLTEEEDILSKTFKGFWLLLLGMLVGVLMMFWQLLLLDVSYSCEESGTTKECFEYQLWNSDAFKTLGRDPIDCNSAAIQNGTVEVICYKLVFNFGVATGASYGTFKTSTFLVNVATSAMIKMVTKAKTVKMIQLVVVLLSLVSSASIIGIQASSFRASFMSGNLIIILQLFVVMGTASLFILMIPWKDIIEEKAMNESQGRNKPGEC